MKITQIVVNESIELGDNFDIELGNTVIESCVVGFMNDGVVVEADDKALALLGIGGALLESVDVNEVSMGDYYKKAKLSQGLGQIEKVFGRSPEAQAKGAETARRREAGLARLDARREKARVANQQKELADLITRLPELKQQYANMRAEYDSLGGSNWQYADREQNLTDNERRARSMEYSLQGLLRQIQAAEKAQKQQGVAEDIDLDQQAQAVADKLTSGKNLEKLKAMRHDSTVYRALDRYFTKNNLPENIYNRVANIVFNRINQQGMAEEYNGNVNDTELKNIDPDNHSQGEGDFVKNQLHTIKRVVTHLDNAISRGENMPDWVQSEIAQAADKIVGVMDYSISSKEQEIEQHSGGSALMKEQGVAEVSSNTLKRYKKAAQRDIDTTDNAGLYTDTDIDRIGRRMKGIDQATSKINANKKKQQGVAEEVDTGQYDAVKSTPKGKEDDEVFRKFREKVRQYGDELGQRQKEKGVEAKKKALKQGVAEGMGNIGNAIKSLYQKIDNAGDDEIEYFYNDSPIFAQYWDEYEGDLDSIIAEVDPAELQIMLDELESYVEQTGLTEAINSIMDLVTPALQTTKPLDGWVQSIYNFIEDHNMKNDPKWKQAEMFAFNVSMNFLKKNGYPNVDYDTRRQAEKLQHRALVQALAKLFQPQQPVTEGQMKEKMHVDAERMDLAAFVDKYGDEDWIKEFWQAVNNIDEAKYQGRTVPLGKPMQGDVKKFKVYVKNKKGNVVKVNFGDPNMRIKKSNPARRKSFRARHRCATAKDRTSARYWSCRKW